MYPYPAQQIKKKRKKKNTPCFQSFPGYFFLITGVLKMFINIIGNLLIFKLIKA
jgi:hypothetical protein